VATDQGLNKATDLELEMAIEKELNGATNRELGSYIVQSTMHENPRHM
jgi:hypothetical protein